MNADGKSQFVYIEPLRITNIKNKPSTRAPVRGKAFISLKSFVCFFVDIDDSFKLN